MNEHALMQRGSYCGRFAPSPTGPLHFGSLVAALGSYLQARSAGGRWLVRIEDLDPPREVPGAAGRILRTLEAYGLTWDGPVRYQSARLEAYRDAVERLLREGLAFHCACSRKEVAEEAARLGRPPHLYPGRCRHLPPRHHRSTAIRALAAGSHIAFVDRLQGKVVQDVENSVGDFVVRRADGLYAYQLAVVVDDADQGITEVVRGSDLLDSTPRQILLQRHLNLPTPDYVHFPVAVNEVGEKLSKQTHAPPLDETNPSPALSKALRFLGQRVPDELEGGSPEELLTWATAHWDLASVPCSLTQPYPRNSAKEEPPT